MYFKAAFRASDSAAILAVSFPNRSVIPRLLSHWLSQDLFQWIGWIALPRVYDCQTAHQAVHAPQPSLARPWQQRWRTAEPPYCHILHQCNRLLCWLSFQTNFSNRGLVPLGLLFLAVCS